jgi:Holliday junction resolvase RusA-like endonuclease
MKNRIEFDVIGKPFGQKRPRAFRRGKFLGIYAPKENVEYAEKVVNAFLKASGGLKLKRLIKKSSPSIATKMCLWSSRYKRSSIDLN